MEENKYNLIREELDGKKYVVAKGVEVMLKEGLCSRPAAGIVLECAKYYQDIRFSKGNKTAQGNSIMSILALEVCKGTRLDVFVEDVIEDVLGHNSEEIVKRLSKGLTTKDFYPNFDRSEE
jgi:phosphotransferase system HPr (HPr) family protein